jgi:DNA-binding NarL/FixJ family response regulator
MDVRMPGIDGIEATRRVVATGPTKVLVLTTFRHDEYVWGALRAGASGFLLKRASPERLIDAVHTVADGDTSAVVLAYRSRLMTPGGPS